MLDVFEAAVFKQKLLLKECLDLFTDGQVEGKKRKEKQNSARELPKWSLDTEGRACGPLRMGYIRKALQQKNIWGSGKRGSGLKTPGPLHRRGFLLCAVGGQLSWQQVWW